MHNLHFLLINADTAEEAASEAERLIQHWGGEDNWRRVGGIASEDGSDDIENHDDGRWGLTYLDEQEGIAREATYFSRAVAYLRREIEEPLAGLRARLDQFSDTLRTFDAERGSPLQLADIGRELMDISELMYGRGRIALTDVPELRDWKLDEEGLTDLTSGTRGARRYLLFVDMHS